MNSGLGPRRTLTMLFLGDPSYDRRVQNFSSYLAANGWRVELIYGSTARATSVSPAVAATLPEPRWLPLTHSAGPRKFLEYRRKLKNAVNDIPHSDVVMACDLYSLTAALRAKRRGIADRLVYDCRELYTGLPSVANKPIARRFWKRVEAKGMMATDLMIVTAPRDVEAVRRVHDHVPANVLVRNLPSVSDRDASVQPLRERFGIPGATTVLVYVGGLQRSRGIGKILDALALLEHAHLILIGSGVERSSIEVRVRELGIASRVHFAGAIPSPEIIPAMRGCNVGVALIEATSESYSLALPSKVFEYLHAGVPVLVSDLVHVRELLGDRNYVEIVDPNAMSEIVRSIERLAAIREPHTIAADARRNFTFEADAANFLSRLERLLDIPGEIE